MGTGDEKRSGKNTVKLGSTTNFENVYIKILIAFISFLLYTTNCFCQEEIEWQPDYRLTLKDFHSPATNLNAEILSIYPGTRIDFSYQMSSYEFMFRKNFNDKVVCKFMRPLASITATDTIAAYHLLQLAQYDFDLGELYARKIRKRMFEEKDAFSGAQFFQPIFNEMDKEKTIRSNEVFSTTQLGQDTVKLKAFHTVVLQEIEQLPDFCRDCKPKRAKKR